MGGRENKVRVHHTLEKKRSHCILIEVIKGPWCSCQAKIAVDRQQFETKCSFTIVVPYTS